MLRFRKTVAALLLALVPSSAAIATDRAAPPDAIDYSMFYLADIRDSIEELKYYRKAVFVPAPGPDSATAKAIAAEFTAPTDSAPA